MDDRTYRGAAFYDDAAVFENYCALRRATQSANDTLDEPTVRALLGAVDGLDVVDLGCGDAGFGLALLKEGAASYTGVDGSANMVAAARRMLGIDAGPGLDADSRGNANADTDAARDRHLVHTRLEDWSPAAASVDLALSRLALHYLADLAPVFANVHRALRPGGRFVFSVEHPVVTASTQPLATRGVGEARLVDHYFDTGSRITNWMGAEVVKHHRTVEDHFAALQAAGFAVDGLRESRPDRANFRDEATFRRYQRVPVFLFMAARKA